jgi:two-component system OmpR family response regulator
MRILIVEDEEKLAKTLKKGLERNGYAVDYLTDGEAGQRRIEISHGEYDAAILDLMLPKKSGFDICREVRAKRITLPILVLTARDAIDDKVLALDSGADDYLIKPFSLEELLARIRALLRRPKESLGTRLEVGDLVLDAARREVRRGNDTIPLTLKEFELLQYLMRNQGKALSREDIFAHLWDFADNAMSNVIDVHMKNMRKKIDGGRREKLLETVRGVGYRIRS